MTEPNAVSAVPSGSAGEPTPTPDVRLPPDEVMREMIDAVLAFDPGEVPEAVAIEWCTEVAMRTPAFQGWLSAVAAAATAQAVEALQARAARCREEDIAETYHLAADCVRALAGGAPARETQGASNADD